MHLVKYANLLSSGRGLDVIQYFKLNYIHFGFILLFAVAGFLIADFIKRRIKRRIVKKSPNPITATFIQRFRLEIGISVIV